jgi:hypothetical protein
MNIAPSDPIDSQPIYRSSCDRYLLSHSLSLNFKVRLGMPHHQSDHSAAITRSSANTITTDGEHCDQSSYKDSRSPIQSLADISKALRLSVEGTNPKGMDVHQLWQELDICSDALACLVKIQELRVGQAISEKAKAGKVPTWQSVYDGCKSLETLITRQVAIREFEEYQLAGSEGTAER